MKRLAVVTSTRAEFGLLLPIIQRLRGYENTEFRVELIVTGTHLHEAYGMTVNEIHEQNIHINHSIFVPMESNTPQSISRNQAAVLTSFTNLFAEQNYNAILILGDRYEMLAVAIAASNTGTPIFHISGGDISEGAIDDCIRHSITKMSYLHFVTNEDSYRRVIQLGEEPSRVFNYGSTSIDNILTVADMNKNDALNSVGVNTCQYAVCTYHPVTIGETCVETQIQEFLDAIAYFPEIQFIVTKSNADYGGARINELLDQAEKRIENLHVYASLGIRRYLSLMHYAQFVLGNSSSGIVEAPVFHVPTINIGNRQRGRLQSESTINCGEKKEDIIEAIKLALSDEHRAICKNVVSPYGDGHAAERISKKIVDTIFNGGIDLRKRFYDIAK